MFQWSISLFSWSGGFCTPVTISDTRVVKSPHTLNFIYVLASQTFSVFRNLMIRMLQKYEKCTEKLVCMEDFLIQVENNVLLMFSSWTSQQSMCFHLRYWLHLDPKQFLIHQGDICAYHDSSVSKQAIVNILMNFFTITICRPIDTMATGVRGKSWTFKIQVCIKNWNI